MTCFDEFAGRWNLGVKNFEEKLMENKTLTVTVEIKR